MQKVDARHEAPITIESVKHYGDNLLILLRLSMFVIFVIFGYEKFTKFASEGLQPIIVNSPLTSWLNIFGIQGASMIIGVAELTFGTLICVGFWRPASILAIAGAAGSVITFLTTLSFLFTTPGVIAPYGPPTPTLIGGFLVKDVVLLAVSIVLWAEGIAKRRAPHAE